jgi:hypothetical protein
MSPETLKMEPLEEAGKRFFGWHRNTSYAAARRGDLPAVKIGNRWFVEIRIGLADRGLELCVALFPRGFKKGREFRVGSIDGEAGQSLGIHLARKGFFGKDFATGERFGDPIALVMKALGLEFVPAIEWSCNFLAMPSIVPAVADKYKSGSGQDDYDARARAKKRWNEAQPIAGTPGDTYLRDIRCICPIRLPRLPDTVRYHPRLYYSDGVYLPGIVAKVQRADGGFCGIHRTFLDPKTGDKIDRKFLGPCKGGGVRLTPIAEEMVIGEGLESCLSVLIADPRRAVFMGLSASLMRSIELPPEVRRIVLLEENDEPDERGRCASPDAVAVLTDRLISEGREVFVVQAPAGFKDMNDVLRRRRQTRAHGSQGATEGGAQRNTMEADAHVAI